MEAVFVVSVFPEHEMIVALGLPLKVAAIILGCIFSTLFSVFNALGPISNPTPPTAALTEFFHADTGTSEKQKQQIQPPQHVK